MIEKTVWVAWTNTDLTEGRGFEIPLAVADNIVTAERLGKGKYVMGSDCRITEEIAVKANGHWLAPCRIHSSSTEDDKMLKVRLAKETVIKKAKNAGLTDDEIEILRERG